MSVLSEMKRVLTSLLGRSEDADGEASDPYLCARCGATYDRRQKECRRCGTPFVVENTGPDRGE